MSEQPENTIIQDEKRKKKLLIVVIVSVILVSVIVVGYIYKSQQKYIPPQPQPKIDLTGSKDKDAAQKSWIAQSTTQLQEQEKKISDLQNTIKNLEQQKLSSPPFLGGQNNAPSPTTTFSSAKSYPPIPPPPPPSASLASDAKGGIQGKSQASAPAQKAMTNLIAIDENKNYPATQPDKDKEAHSSDRINEQKEDTKDTFIPAGAFVKVVLMTGVDAPTGGKGKGSPYPVLLRLTDPAQFPNRWEGAIQECFMVGEAYGELSSERAHIRLNTLSCINKRGDYLETSLNGYVVGEDGKTGFAGRVVTKQGALLARSLITGFAQGISQAFSQSATVLNVTPTGNVSTIDPSKTVQAGIGSGISKATEDLAKFYMDIAKEMFPVVEVNAGRKGEAVFINKVVLLKTSRERK